MPWLEPGLSSSARWALLVEHVRLLGWTICSGHLSYANPLTRRIVLSRDLVEEDRLAVLAHEAAHARQFPGGLGARVWRLLAYAGSGRQRTASENDARSHEAAVRHAVAQSHHWPG